MLLAVAVGDALDLNGITVRPSYGSHARRSPQFGVACAGSRRHGFEHCPGGIVGASAQTSTDAVHGGKWVSPLTEDEPINPGAEAPGDRKYQHCCQG